MGLTTRQKAGQDGNTQEVSPGRRVRRARRRAHNLRKAERLDSVGGFQWVFDHTEFVTKLSEAEGTTLRDKADVIVAFGYSVNLSDGETVCVYTAPRVP